MIITIKNSKAREIFVNNVFYPTNQPLDLPFSDALRIARLCSSEISPSRIADYDPSLFKNDKKFAMVCDIDTVSGWGNVGLNLIHYSPDYNPGLIGRLLQVNDPIVHTASRAPIEPGMAAIIHEQPRHDWLTYPFKKKIAIVPFETTMVPFSWVARINSCDALLVPCQQNVEAFRNSGVTIPIDVIHWGVEPKLYNELERSTNRPFTFGTMGALSIRKGTDILVEAFERAFPTEKDVRLICKTSFNGFMWARKDKRVKVELMPWSYEEMRDNFFREIDCFVFPTRGEGFGLTPLEAMATGVPAIVTGWSGPLEYMTPEVGWLINHTMAPAKDFSESVYKEDCGEWANPSVDHLVQLMRYAYEHQDEVKAKGKLAAQHVRDNWLWEKKIGMFHNALSKYL